MGPGSAGSEPQGEVSAARGLRTGPPRPSSSLRPSHTGMPRRLLLCSPVRLAEPCCPTGSLGESRDGSLRQKGPGRWRAVAWSPRTLGPSRPSAQCVVSHRLGSTQAAAPAPAPVFAAQRGQTAAFRRGAAPASGTRNVTEHRRSLRSCPHSPRPLLSQRRARRDPACGARDCTHLLVRCSQIDSYRL